MTDELNYDEFSDVSKSQLQPNPSLLSASSSQDDLANSRLDRYRVELTEYDMSRYAYSLVKGGYTILAPEPSQRSRSYRDLILQEMNWMAVDYYEERRWKAHVAKHICTSIQASVIDKIKLKHDWPARQCSYYITNFWLNIKGIEVIGDISNSLRDYCVRISEGRDIVPTSSEFAEISPAEQTDLIALSVPVYRTNGSIAVAKNEVVTSTIHHMIALGAEIYPPIFRPPCDELDVFTLPALQPKHDFDYNILSLLLYSLKNYSPCPTKKYDLQLGLYQNANTAANLPPGSMGAVNNRYPTQNSFSNVLSIRWIPRDEIDPYCISMNYRDFLEAPPVQPVHPQKFVLKWDDVAPTENDFELLDDWMLKDKCWTFIAVALNLRSSSGGLVAHEFSPNTCQISFSRISRIPRGLNSSRKLLGPKQSKTIISFIGPPPNTVACKHVIPIEPQADDKGDVLDCDYRFLFGDAINTRYINKCRIFSTTDRDGSKADKIFSRLRIYSDKGGKTVTLKEDTGAGESDGWKLLVPRSVRHEVYLTQPPSDWVGETSETIFTAPEGKAESLMGKLGYSEWSNRMHKQLRIGFLGIPTKMFVYSLFYSGRIRRDFRVRRVALSISNISKFVPPPHLLYGKTFDSDLNLMLSKSRSHSWDKRKSLDANQSESSIYSSELLQKYMNETNSSTDENIPELLATYAKLALSRGISCAQSSFSNTKIVINSTSCGSTSNTSNSTDNTKRKASTSLDNTPKHNRVSTNRLDFQVDKGNMTQIYRTPDASALMRWPMQMYNVPQIINGKIVYNPMNIGSPRQMPMQQWQNDEEFPYRFNEQYRR